MFSKNLAFQLVTLFPIAYESQNNNTERVQVKSWVRFVPCPMSLLSSRQENQKDFQVVWFTGLTMKRD